MTGDLVNLSLPGEYAPALAWLESLGSPRDVTLVPGNHDAYVWTAARLPQTEWSRYLSGDDTAAPPWQASRYSRFCAGEDRWR